MKRHFFNFFSIDFIPLGMSKVKGIDGKEYLLYVPFKFTIKKNKLLFNGVKDKEIYATGKSKSHMKLVYKNSRQHYSNLWANNKIYTDNIYNESF